MWTLLDDDLRCRVDRRIIRYTKRVTLDNSCIIWTGYRKGNMGIPYLHLSKDNVHYEVNIPQYLLEKYLNRKLKLEHQANHTCDNIYGPCVAIQHIYEGTHSQNMLDMYLRQRRDISGVNATNAKLTLIQVNEIKKKLEKGIKGITLADEYNVSNDCISKIKLGYSWKETPREEEQAIIVYHDDEQIGPDY